MSPFNVKEGASPLILSFPHSGINIPEEIAKNLSPEGQKKADTDWHVPRLYEFARAMDVTWVEAKISRYVIDLNRDPAGASLYPGKNTTALCPVESFDGLPIWQDGHAPDTQEIERRLQCYFTPYHEVITAQISRVKARHGFAVLYDCHSIRGAIPHLFEGGLPTLNLGTFQGQSCVADLQADLAAVLQNSPLEHVVNGRFRGGWITRHYGKPENNIHAVQMEIAQHAYMEEVPPWRWNDSPAAYLQTSLQAVLEAVLQWGRGQS